MSKKVGVQYDQTQLDGFEAMEEDGQADSTSEAIRTAATVGLQQMGYVNGEQQREQSTLGAAGELVGFAAGVAAIAWFGVTFAYPVEIRLPAMAALLASLTAFGIARVADGGGLALRRRLGRLFGGESA